jgi:hypothetical protein
LAPHAKAGFTKDGAASVTTNAQSPAAAMITNVLKVIGIPYQIVEPNKNTVGVCDRQLSPCTGDSAPRLAAVIAL